NRYNPRFMQEIEENEDEIRRVMQYVLESKLYYYIRYNEPRLRKELIDALNAYFKYGQIDSLSLSGWPAVR
ncbi:MAG: hypothetical protein LBV04_04820, partial [Deferribacteraceae bacterium]|nr:hypothetical protein [Deferribacteraceae bacterium]